MKKLFSATAALFVLAAVSLTLAPAAPVDAEGKDVTFVNRSTRTQHVLAAFGGDGACSDLPQKRQLELAPKESNTVESNGSKVCYCTSPVGKVGDCGPAWKKVKSGRTVTLR